MTDPWIGSQLGHYRIEQFIGRGGMGVVYRAVHVELGRTVALKLLAPELAQNQEFRDRFVRESRLAAGIDHPNVIPIYEAGDVEGTYFIAMRFVDGVDLRESVAAEGPLRPSRALSIVSQVAGALDAAHALNLVHRDVKPGNILLVRDSEHCYLTDFGLTKAMSSNTAFTATGHFVGTTDYVAPEQIEGKALDRRTDVYSLGCVLFELLTGAPPYKREADLAVMYAHIQEAVPRMTERRPDLPAGLDSVIETALAKSKDGRYPTCSALAGAAQAALGPAGASGAATAPAPAPPPLASSTQPREAAAAYVPPPPPPAPPAPPATVEHATGRSRPVTAIALIVAALLIGLGGTAAALIVTGGDDPAPVASTDRTDDTNSGESPSTRTDDPTEDPGTPPSTGPPDVEEGPPDDSGGDEAPAIAAAVEQHFQAIEDQDFAAAWEYFGPPYTSRNSRSGWIGDHEDEGIGKITANITASGVSGSSATAEIVELVTNSETEGCQSWQGSYGMKKIAGSWKIGTVEISDSPC